jgi:hypothetical protein
METVYTSFVYLAGEDGDKIMNELYAAFHEYECVNKVGPYF